MKNEEDEAFDELARRQGMWGGGFPAKRAMAADKLQDGKCKYCVDGCIACDARAQPAQEPVAWLEPEWGEKICPEVGYEATITDDHPRDLCWIPLYTASPKRPWVSLTDEEIKEIIGTWGDTPVKGYTRKLFDQIEAKLRSKNNG